MPRRRRAGLLLAVLLVLACLAIPDARAQCSMCAANAEASAEGRSATWTFLQAVGFLLVPTVGLLGGAGALLWRFREPRER
jgi:nitrate reductase NapE component